MIFTGCCGFQKSQQSYYQHFPAIEIQKTFYKPPRKSTAERWRNEAPDDFVFCLKAWQVITHPASSPTYRKARLKLSDDEKKKYGFFQATDPVFHAWDKTLEIAETLNAAVVVFQCPKRFTPTDEHKENLKEFFKRIERHDMVFAWEPRGDWSDEEITELCTDLNMLHCVDPFSRHTVTKTQAYFRMHGIESYYYNHNKKDLDKLYNWCQSYEQAFAMFNNVSMWDDALAFQNMLA